MNSAIGFVKLSYVTVKSRCELRTPRSVLLCYVTVEERREFRNRFRYVKLHNGRDTV